MERRDRLKQSYMVMQDVNYELFAESVEAGVAPSVSGTRTEPW